MRKAGILVLAGSIVLGGASSTDAGAWRRVTWRGGDAVPLSATAPDASAVRYVLRLRHVQ